MLSIYKNFDTNTYDTPFIYEKKVGNDSFYMFEETIFPDVGNTPHSCYDTIDSKCTLNVSMDECLKKCNDDTMCGAGIYLQDISDGKSICMPFRTRIFEDANPITSVRTDYNIVSDYNINSTVFLKKSQYTYPMNYTGRVSFNSNVFLVNENTSLTTKNSNQPITFLDGTNTPSLRIFPNYDVQNIPRYLYTFVRYGNEMMLNLTQTNLVLYKDKEKNAIEWQSKLGPKITPESLFTVTNVNEPDKFGKPLLFFDTFQILHENKVLAIDENDTLTLIDKDNIDTNKYKINFKFVPSVAHYCNGSKCETLPEEKNWDLTISKDGNDNLMWNGNQVFISKTCGLYCDYNKNIIAKLFRKSPRGFITFWIVLLCLILFYMYNK
jgi:hypothetical protein